MPKSQFLALFEKLEYLGISNPFSCMAIIYSSKVADTLFQQKVICSPISQKSPSLLIVPVIPRLNFGCNV